LHDSLVTSHPSHLHSMRFRISKTVLLYLLVGAAINLAVAWIAIICVKCVYFNDVPGNYSYQWSRYMKSCQSSVTVEQLGKSVFYEEIILTGKCTCEGVEVIFDYSSGWPYLAVNGQDWRVKDKAGNWVRVSRYWYSLDATVVSRFAKRDALIGIPMNPLWPGFMLNSVLYAVVAFIAIRAAKKAKRGIRLLQSKCPACGYLCNAGICPECGRQIMP
jgi:hypothetical protein